MLFLKGRKLKSNHQRCSVRKSVLRNFAKFTGKHLQQSLFFNKVARPATLLKKRLWHRWFPVNFAKFLRTPFLIEYLSWLLLYINKTFYCIHSIYQFYLMIVSGKTVFYSIQYKNLLMNSIEVQLLLIFYLCLHSQLISIYCHILRSTDVLKI